VFQIDRQYETTVTVPPQTLCKAAEEVATFKINTKVDGGITVQPRGFVKLKRKLLLYMNVAL